MRRTTITSIIVVLAVAVASPAAAGGGGIDAQPCRSFGAGPQLTMRDNCFEGTGHTISAGATLTVHNRGRLGHTFTAVDGSFDTGIVEPGGSVDLDVGGAAVVPVYCELHATVDGDGMAGLLVIEGEEDEHDLELAAAAAEDGSPGSWAWWLVVVVLTTVVASVATRRVVSRRAARVPAAAEDG